LQHETTAIRLSIMNQIFRIYFNSIASLLLLVLSVACQSQQITYTTDPAMPVAIGKSRHPVHIIIRDVRTEKPAAVIFKSEQDRRGALNPDVLRQEILKDPVNSLRQFLNNRLTANQISFTEQENENTVVIELNKYDIIYDVTDNKWKAYVILNISSDLHSQTINTTYEAANTSGNDDGVKVLSTAVSMSADRISWEKHLPDSK